MGLLVWVSPGDTLPAQMFANMSSGCTVTNPLTPCPPSEQRESTQGHAQAEA